MPRIVVLGGGVCGLAAGLLLARDGHAVTLLERDPAPVPDSPEAAWEAWERRGVAQFHQTHFLQSRGRRVLEDELPDVLDAFAAAGAARFNALDRMPPGIADRAPRPGDDRFATLTGRRTTLEHVLAGTAAAQPGLTVRRGDAAFELITRPGRAAPHVVGVRTAAGEALGADLVVDAMGRGSRMPQLAAAAGGEPGEEEAEDCGFIYYTRFFRGPAAPELRGPLLTPYGSFSILTAPADSGTWSITVYVASGDRPLKRLRHEAAWTALVRACPLQAHWLDGEPISGVLAMAGVLDRRRAATPTVTGVAAVGDAWACTNPSTGRGIALGLSHVALLRDTVRAHLGDPDAFAEAWRETTARELEPWYRATVAADRARLAQMTADREGRVLDPPGDRMGALGAAMMRTMAHDAEVFRAALEISNVLAHPREVFGRPGFADRLLALAGEQRHAGPPGPSREDLLALVA